MSGDYGDNEIQDDDTQFEAAVSDIAPSDGEIGESEIINTQSDQDDSSPSDQSDSSLSAGEILQPTIPESQRAPLLQALIISFGDPVSLEQLAETTHLTPDEIRSALSELRALLAVDSSGIELVEVGSRFQIRTKVAFSPFIRTLKAERPRRLSAPALETLAIVAYQQPVAKSDIDKLRGVDSTPTLKTLLERGLVKVVGQASSVGHPSLYGTTDTFLTIFGLGALTDLPSLREASSLERDPGEPDEEKDDDNVAILSADDEDRGLEDESSINPDPMTDEEPLSLKLPVGLASRIAIERISPEEEARIREEHEAQWFLEEDPKNSGAE
jgi:segregation and condensation protein B